MDNSGAISLKGKQLIISSPERASQPWGSINFSSFESLRFKSFPRYRTLILTSDLKNGQYTYYFSTMCVHWDFKKVIDHEH